MEDDQIIEKKLYLKSVQKNDKWFEQWSSLLFIYTVGGQFFQPSCFCYLFLWSISKQTIVCVDTRRFTGLDRGERKAEERQRTTARRLVFKTKMSQNSNGAKNAVFFWLLEGSFQPAIIRKQAILAICQLFVSFLNTTTEKQINCRGFKTIPTFFSMIGGLITRCMEKSFIAFFFENWNKTIGIAQIEETLFRNSSLKPSYEHFGRNTSFAIPWRSLPIILVRRLFKTKIAIHYRKWNIKLWKRKNARFD